MRITFTALFCTGLWFWSGGVVTTALNHPTKSSLTRTFYKEKKRSDVSNAVNNLRDIPTTSIHDEQRHLAIADTSACIASTLPSDPSYLIGTSIYCPDLCGPGRDFTISTFTYTLSTLQLCLIPCAEEPVVCAGGLYPSDRDAENDCSLCDYGISAGGGLRSCFFNSNGLWQCYHETFPLSWVPATESAIIYTCDTLPEIEPTPENCRCDIYLGDPTVSEYDEDKFCQSCTIFSTALDGEIEHYWDCSNLLEGSCVGEDESGCISNVATSPATPVSDSSPPPVSLLPVTSPPVLTPIDSQTSPPVEPAGPKPAPNPTSSPTSAPLEPIVAATPVGTKPPTDEPDSDAATVPTNASPVLSAGTLTGNTSIAPSKNWSTHRILGAALFVGLWLGAL